MSLVDLIFPKKCLGCGKANTYLCKECIEKARKEGFFCPYCERFSIDGKTHFQCRREYGLDGLTSIWRYEGVIRKAILGLKYKFAMEIAKELAEASIPQLNRSYFKGYILVPIPLHWHRANWRGFNQAEEIGKILAKEMGWKFIPDLLIRKKSTTPQTELKGKERRKNTMDAFILNRKYKTRGKILLFDDVITTGSTMKEAAKVLKKEGAEKVWGLTIAR